MKTFNWMAIKLFVPAFIVSVLFFVLVLQLVDIFTYIWRYISLEVPLSQILLVQLYYLPKCVSFAVSPSLLFAISFTLGTFYANNELISVFGSGISLYRFVIPFVVFGIILSAAGFFFEENIVISTYKSKNTLSQSLLRQQKSLSHPKVTVIGSSHRIIYFSEYYNDSAKTLRSLTVLERDENSEIIMRIDAETAVWKNDKWELQNARVFTWNEDRSFFTETDANIYSRDDINEPPETFRKENRNVEEMRTAEAEAWIENLRKAGLPYREPLTEYYRRYSFALTPLIVAFISCAIGSRFKKNILLMSLLLSLVISVLYYVSQMVAVIAAKLAFFDPLMGAWGPFLIFLFASLWLFKTART